MTIRKILVSPFRNNLFTSFFSLAIFFVFCYVVKTKIIDNFDKYLLDLLPEILPKYFISFARIFYFIGNAEVSAAVVLLSLIILVRQRQWLEAKVIAVSSLNVLIVVNQILKPLFYRRRPLQRLVSVDGRSFPSGHATGNILLYFLLVYILSVRFPKLTIYLYVLSTLILIMMGISSVYLRVHWPSDILAGYCLGYVLYTISVFYLKISAKKYR